MMLPPTQHYLAWIRLQRKISFVKSFTISKWLKNTVLCQIKWLIILHFLSDLKSIFPQLLIIIKEIWLNLMRNFLYSIFFIYFSIPPSLGGIEKKGKVVYKSNSLEWIGNIFLFSFIGSKITVLTRCIKHFLDSCSNN